MILTMLWHGNASGTADQEQEKSRIAQQEEKPIAGRALSLLRRYMPPPRAPQAERSPYKRCATHPPPL